MGRGESFAPAPQVAVESLWFCALAWGLVDEEMGKWLATLGAASCVGLGYALPSMQLYLAGRRLRVQREARKRTEQSETAAELS